MDRKQFHTTMTKQKKSSRRFTITPNHERMLANFFYGIIPNLESTRTDTAIKVVHEEINPETGVSECRDYEVDIEEWIKLIGIDRVKNINLPYYIEILLKYHISLQTSRGTIDTGYYELRYRENGHDLFLLYQKTTPDFQEKLKASYDQYISEANWSGNTDIEILLRNTGKLYTQFRYDFFSKIDSNNEIVPQKNKKYDISELLFLVKSLYDLTNLRNLRGITVDNIQESDYRILMIPLH